MFNKLNQFDNSSMRILWAEAILFSGLFGVAHRSWLVPIILFSILFVLLRNSKMAIYAVFILSLLWALIFAGIALELGWAWAAALGGFVFYKGVRIHWRELKQQDGSDTFINIHNWRQNWYLGRQNLN